MSKEVIDEMVDSWVAIGYIEPDVSQIYKDDEGLFWERFRAFKNWKPHLPTLGQRHYAITLTLTSKRSEDDLLKSVRRVLTSKCVVDDTSEFQWCRELTKVGMPHVHIYLKTPLYVRARDILRMNDCDRVDVKTIKGIEINKWLNYIAKDMVPYTSIEPTGSNSGRTTSPPRE